MPGPALRPRLLAAGFTDDELRRLRAERSVVAVRPGAYVHSSDARLREPEGRHALQVEAAVQQIGPGAVVSHASAAVLHGLPLWAVPLDRVHVTRDRRSGGRRTRYLHLHPAALDPDEIALVRGIAVTSVARTVADLARSLPFEAAVVAADGALRDHPIGRADLLEAVQRRSNRRGTSAARRVAAFADGRSESVGESRSRVALARCGLPPPVLQWEVRTTAGRWLARVDFGWPEHMTVGEFDGRVKYGRLLRPGQDPGDAVFEEKRREDALRDEDLRVGRWTWADLDAFDPVAQRLRRGFRER